MSQFVRTEMLIGKENVEKLKNASVIVYGIGGVGGFCVEALARAGVGKIGLVDNDTVNESNLNRQIVALHSTIGRKKIEVMKERLLEINPNICVKCYDVFVLNDNINVTEIGEYQYIVDCVDTVTAKIEIILNAKKLGKYVISSMGTGNKLDPSKFTISDISKTSVCPLAAVMRRELKKRGICEVPVLFSTELPLKPIENAAQDVNSVTFFGDEKELCDEKNDNCTNSNIKCENDASFSVKSDCFTNENTNKQDERKKRTPASISFVPAVAGLLIGGEIIRAIIS